MTSGEALRAWVRHYTKLCKKCREWDLGTGPAGFLAAPPCVLGRRLQDAYWRLSSKDAGAR